MMSNEDDVEWRFNVLWRHEPLSYSTQPYSDPPKIDSGGGRCKGVLTVDIFLNNLKEKLHPCLTYFLGR